MYEWILGQVWGSLNPSKRAGMTNPVRYEAGGNEVTKLTRQSRNALSESNSNLYPIGWVRTLQPLEDTSCGGGT